MSHIEFKLIRNADAGKHPWTHGQLFVNDIRLGHTLEDMDRQLEIDPTAKIAKQTAIPRGRYRLTHSMSNRFGRIMPEIKNVPGYSGVRIHGGNTIDNTEGCPLLGADTTDQGVHNCKKVNEDLLARIVSEEDDGNECWITVS